MTFPTQVGQRPGLSRGAGFTSTGFVSPSPGWPAVWLDLRETVLPYVLIDADSGKVIELSDFVADQLRAPAFVAQWQSWLRQQQHAELRSYISREAARQECISVVVGDWEEDGVDLLFVVEGDLYDGESAVVPIVYRLTSAFPNVALDLMVLPASVYHAEFRWGSASEVLYRRQQATA